MRYLLVGLTALALAAAAFAGENTGEIISTKVPGPGDGQAFETILNDAGGNPLMHVKCTAVGQGKKDVKLYWLDPEHMPDAEAKFYFTWGDKVKEVLVGKNCIGLAQFRDFYPEGKATITMRVVFVGQVANRVKLGNIKADYIVPVANSPGYWGSVINDKGLKGKREEGIPTPKYLDLTEYGATLEVDTTNYEATFTWKYEPTQGFMITDGQLDIGLIQYQR
jgi:hypothetical protein